MTFDNIRLGRWIMEHSLPSEQYDFLLSPQKRKNDNVLIGAGIWLLVSGLLGLW
jgi:hypothetical protein